MAEKPKQEDLIAQLLARSSSHSLKELLRYRARFDKDRRTQQLSENENKTLLKFLENEQTLECFEVWRRKMNHAAARHMGVAEHIIPHMDWYLEHDAARQEEKRKVIYSPKPGKLHIFKITKMYYLPPRRIVDGETQQSAQLSPADARNSNLPYELSIVVDIDEFIFVDPALATSSSSSSSTAAAASAGSKSTTTTTTNTSSTKRKKGKSASQLEPTLGKRLTAKEAKAARFKLPDGWQNWRLEATERHLRQPWHEKMLLTGSWMDRRASGFLPPHTFAQEDRYDEGGYYASGINAIHMPACETLAHNNVFYFPSNPSSSSGGPTSQSTAIAMETTLEDEGCETPDTKEPFAFRQAKAVMGLQLHSNKVHRLEVRCCHPSLRHCSTSTIHLILAKQTKKQQPKNVPVSIQLQFLQQVPMPSTVVFLALGVRWEEAKAMMRSVAGEHWYGEAFDIILRKMETAHPKGVVTPEDARLWIVSFSDKKNLSSVEKRLEHALTFLQKQLFPQVGTFRNKAMFLSALHFWLFMGSVGYRRPDNKNSYVKQRCDTNAIMWASLQRQMGQRIHTQAESNLRKHLAQQVKINWAQIFNSAKMSDIQQSCVTRGIWAPVKHLNGAARSGVTLPLKTTCQATINASLRRCNTSHKQNRRSIAIKQLCESMWSRLCSVETPEGEQCGNARFLAMMSTFSLPSSSKALLGLMRLWIPSDEWIDAGVIDPEKVKEYPYLIDLDGELIWRCRDPTVILNKLRTWRRSGLASAHMGCGLDGSLLSIQTSPGRNIRLLFVLKNFVNWLVQMHENWMDRVKSASPASPTVEEPAIYDMPLTKALSLGLIEWIDAQEEQSLSIASSFEYVQKYGHLERFSHMEIDPKSIFGMTAQMLPFPDMNQTPRSVLACAMMKQTFSGIVNPYKVLSPQHILEYGSKPLVRTDFYEKMQYQNTTRGQHVLAALAVDPWTIEDSQRFNISAFQFGLMRTSLLKRFAAHIKPPEGNRREVFGKSDRTCGGMQDANYNKLQQDGTTRIGTAIEGDDIILGKYIEEVQLIPVPNPDPMETSSKPTTVSTSKRAKGSNGTAVQQTVSRIVRTDDSVSVKDERGIVLSVKTIKSDYAGGHIIKEVIIRSEGMNEIGDKYWTTHGQKGTGGAMSPGANMLFSCVTGAQVQMVKGVQGEISRMTSGDLHEIEMGRAAAYSGEFIAADAFRSEGEKKRAEMVKYIFGALGADKYSREAHINGETGEMTEPLFVGLIQVSPLAHLVCNKLHARNYGPVKMSNRQADDGRSRNGGLRLGGMETDCLIAQGCKEAVGDRLTKGDQFPIGNCTVCGAVAGVAEVNVEKATGFCRSCRTNTVRVTYKAYSNNLLFQDFMALHLRAHMESQEVDSIMSSSEEIDMENNANIDERVVNKGEEEYVKDQKDPIVCSDYHKLRMIPQPMAWEAANYGVGEDLNLEQFQATMTYNNTSITTPIGIPSLGFQQQYHSRMTKDLRPPFAMPPKNRAEKRK